MIWTGQVLMSYTSFMPKTIPSQKLLMCFLKLTIEINWGIKTMGSNSQV